MAIEKLSGVDCMKCAWLGLTVFSISLAAPLAAFSDTETCPGFVRGASTQPDIDRTYAARAVSIMAAGLKNDARALSALVSPNAQFTVWHGDAAYSPRDGRKRLGGVGGGIQFAHHVNPDRFQIVTIQSGPISVAPVKCEWSVNVLFLDQRHDAGISIAFKFVDGLLVEATGHQTVLYQGDVP
ncbi:hypothetical protein [Novosphingobium malaysiense]|uniref:SnoaL-like domain-containing protein n=1 Tax=Novosphingobium malaysiense TaxID=1348853 RepID=A0A0B1ZV35_9SPHN|nr:hypothetical protein [Novosphingobium malaysiense]KHK92987.1 hypothetical protein LK12_00945 [Novosphingobium malaysiense]